ASFLGGETEGEGDDGSSFESLGARPDGRITNLAQHVAHGWAELPMPVIAAVHGHALGGGIQIALGADIRIVSPEAKMSVLEIRWGLLPDMSGIPALIRLVGLDIAKELAFTGRFVEGDEAVQLGIATRSEADRHAVEMELAHDIARKSAHAILGMKHLLNAAGTRPLSESLVEETRFMIDLIGSKSQMEAVMAHMEDRSADFADPD